MSRVAQITNGVVVNVIVAELEWALEHAAAGCDLLLETEVAGPGWLCVEGELIPPPSNPAEEPVIESASLTPLAFTRLFTLAERIAMQTSNDPIIQDGMLMLQVAQEVKLDDPDTIALVGYMAQQGFITTERAVEILEE